VPYGGYLAGILFLENVDRQNMRGFHRPAAAAWRVSLKREHLASPVTPEEKWSSLLSGAKCQYVGRLSVVSFVRAPALRDGWAAESRNSRNRTGHEILPPKLLRTCCTSTSAAEESRLHAGGRTGPETSRSSFRFALADTVIAC
jgi:hypothetical protein